MLSNYKQISTKCFVKKYNARRILDSFIMAEWQSGYAADCKSVNAGSIPTSASMFSNQAK